MLSFYFDQRTVFFSERKIMPGQQQERIRLSSMGGESTCSNSSSGGSGSGSTTMKIRRRVVMMGAARVGKTSIIKQFLYDQFPDRYKETIEELHRGERIIYFIKARDLFYSTIISIYLEWYILIVLTVDNYIK